MAADIPVCGMIALMALTVFATRVTGSELMRFIKLTPRLEIVLKSMATSVLIAFVVSHSARGGMREGLAVLVAILTMLAFRNPLVSMSAGIVVAAFYSFVAA